MTARLVVAGSSAVLALACHSSAQPPREPTAVSQTTSAQRLPGTTSQPLVAEPMLGAEGSQMDAPSAPDQRSRKIRDGIVADSELPTTVLERVRIEATDGHVVLSGSVPTLADKVELERRVRQLDDVWSVDNRIKVESPTPPPPGSRR